VKINGCYTCFRSGRGAPVVCVVQPVAKCKRHYIVLVLSKPLKCVSEWVVS